MQAQHASLVFAYALAAIAATALALAPISISYALLLVAASAVGLWWDLRGKRPVPRRLLTVLGIIGFIFSFFPPSREFFTEQSLSALAILTAVKILSPKERRDYLQFLLLALIITAGAASLVPDLVFGSLLLCNLLLSILLLLWLPFADQLQGGLVPRALLKRLLYLGGAIALLSIPTTIFIFLIIPRAANPYWRGFGLKPERVSGFSDRITLGQIGRISLSPDVAFRAVMDSPAGPLDAPPYWRGLVMEATDGVNWSTTPSAQAVPMRTEAGTTRITYYVAPHGERQLFVLEVPISVTSNFRGLPLGRGRVASVFSPLVRPIRYTAMSRPGGVLPGIAGQADLALNLALPVAFSPRIRELALRLASGDTDPDLVANRLAAHFASGFTYALEAPAVGGNPLEGFLFTHHTGYCEYYASALALMLRATGVPARVVVGYLGGEYNETGGYYLVRQSAAHAWVEYYRAGTGWVRIDPTPARETGATFASGRAPRPWLWLDNLRMHWNSWVIQYDTESQVGFARSLGERFSRLMSRAVFTRVALWSGLILLIFMGLVASYGKLRLRVSDPLQSRWLELGRALDRRGMGRRPDEGPRDWARRVGEACPPVRGIMDRFTGVYVLGRYADGTVGRDDLARLDRWRREILGGMRRARCRRKEE